MSQGWPARCTGTIAFVRSVTSSATRAGSTFRSASRTSAKIGAAPAWTITFAVAGQVIGLVITSSPGPIPSASSERWSAAVPEERATTCRAPRYSANRASSSAVRGPVVSQPERSVSATASTSSSPIAGGWKPRKVARRSAELCDFRIRDDEAYEIGHAAIPRERLLAARPDGDHGSRAIAARAEGPELVAGRAVDVEVDDTLDGARCLDALGRCEAPLRRDEEARAGAADLRLGPRRLERLAERGRDREPVELDAERGVAELGVVAAAEARGKLDHLRPVGSEPELRVRRAVLDPESLGGSLGRLDRPLVRALARPDVRERHPEGRRLGRHPVRHRERDETAPDREGIDRHLGPLDELLDERDPGARGLEGARDSRGEILGPRDEGQSPLPLPQLRDRERSRGGRERMGKPQVVGDPRRDADRPVGARSDDAGDVRRAGEPLDCRLVFRGQDRAPVRVPEAGSAGIAIDGDHVEAALLGGAEQADLRRPGA